jgi:peptidyl-prolyl cis-trans isomerase D
MALIGRIRKHSGLLIILIGVALAGFVLQDFFRKSGGGRNKNQIFAKIGSEKVNKMDFDQKVNDQVKRYLQQTKKENLTSAENFQLMTSVWDQFEKETIMQKEYEEVGLAIDHDNNTKPSISAEELNDLFFGKTPHPYVTQNFTDPNTGVLNTQAIKNYLQNFDQLTDDQKTEWKQFEQGIKDDRIKTKYNNLISQGYYIPKVLLKRMSDDASKTAKLLSVGVKYQTISDSVVKVTDEDFNKFYEAHKHEYQQERGRDIDYVIFDPVPSEADMKKITDKANFTYGEFQKIESNDVENFMKANSDAPYDSNFFSKGKLQPAKLDSVMFASAVGTVVAPFIDNNNFNIARLVQIQNRPDSIKASHILIAYKDAPNPMENITRTKDQAKKIADSLLEVVKKDINSFASLATTKSDFPSAKKDNGDLGWMVDGNAETKFFFDSCLVAKVGSARIIQSALGYHVLYVTDKKKEMKKVKVAIAKLDIKPSTETFNRFQTQASQFAGENRTAEQFNKTVAAKGLNKRSAQFVKEMDYTIPGLETARDIIRWAYDEKTEKGMVSEQVFDNSGKFVVALIVEKREKGIAPLDLVKTYIEPLVKREKKADQIIEKVKNASTSTKDIYQVARQLNVTVDTVDQLNFTAYNFPKFGPEPELIGTIFTMKKNELSAPVRGKMAIYEVLLEDITAPANAANTDMIKMQTLSNFKSRVENEVYKAIKDNTKIVDNRIFYY